MYAIFIKFNLDVTIDVNLSYNPFIKEWVVQRSDEVVEELASGLQESKITN